MPNQKSTERVSPFTQTLRRLAQSANALTPSDIKSLSMPSPDDLAAFRVEWTQIAVERQRAILAAMNEAAELSIHADFTDLFIILLDDQDEYVRAQAIDGLWENEIPSVGRRLLRLLMEDRSEWVRAAAAEGLGHFLLKAELGRMSNPSAPTMTEALLTRFNDLAEDQDVRRRALESVAYSGDQRVHAAIEEAYADDDQAMRISAVFAMGRSADQSWGEVVTEELNSQDPAMRYEAAYAAGALTVVDALPQLIDMVGDVDPEVRQSAIWALGQIGGNEARRVLEAVLESDEASLHAAAEEALAELEFAAGVAPFSLFEFDVHEAGNSQVQDEMEDEEEG